MRYFWASLVFVMILTSCATPTAALQKNTDESVQSLESHWKTDVERKHFEDGTVEYMEFSLDQLEMRIPKDFSRIVESEDSTEIIFSDRPFGLAFSSRVLDKYQWKLSLQTLNDICINEGGGTHMKKEPADVPAGLENISDITITKFDGNLGEDGLPVRGYVLSSYECGNMWIIMGVYQDEETRAKVDILEKIYQGLYYSKEK